MEEEEFISSLYTRFLVDFRIEGEKSETNNLECKKPSSWRNFAMGSFTCVEAITQTNFTFST